MTVLERVAGVWFAVLDASAGAAAALAARLSTRQRITAVEGEGGHLLIHADGKRDAPPLSRIDLASPGSHPPTARLLRRSHVTLDLDPRRFVFRAIDLPGRATEFIKPIVRTQIDRLTPWPSDQVVFGCGSPMARGGEGGVTLVVAATSRAFLEPLMQRVQDLGAAVVVARVPLPADLIGATVGAAPVVEIARLTAAAFAVAFWRGCLGIVTSIVVVLVIVSSLFGQVAAIQLTSAAEELAHEAVTKRALVAEGVKDKDPAASARRFVDQRKTEAPYATLVLEAVSRILPDNTFATSLEMTGTRLRLVGFSADAPALIRLIDESGLLAEASFFAPTTRLPEDPGDRFNIEATIRPDGFPR